MVVASHPLDPALLSTFLTVLDHGRISGSAKVLHLSQPAVTAQIRKLEQALGATLFVRSVHGVTPTEAGLRLASYARSVQKLLDEAVEELSSLEEQSGPLVVAASTTIAAHVLPPLFAQFRAVERRVPLRLYVGNTEEVVNEVRAGRVPLGLVEGTARAAGVRLEPFIADEIVPIVGREGHVFVLATSVISSMFRSSGVRRGRERVRSSSEPCVVPDFVVAQCEVSTSNSVARRRSWVVRRSVLVWLSFRAGPRALTWPRGWFAWSRVSTSSCDGRFPGRCPPGPCPARSRASTPSRSAHRRLERALAGARPHSNQSARRPLSLPGLSHDSSDVDAGPIRHDLAALDSQGLPVEQGIDHRSAPAFQKSSYRAARDPHPLACLFLGERIEFHESQGLELVQGEGLLLELRHRYSPRLEVRGCRRMANGAWLEGARHRDVYAVDRSAEGRGWRTRNGSFHEMRRVSRGIRWGQGRWPVGAGQCAMSPGRSPPGRGPALRPRACVMCVCTL